MKKNLFAILVLLSNGMLSNAQDAPNVANFSPLSPNTEQASKLASVPVNIFTGVPIINVPIYQYASQSNGLHWGVSLNYNAKGTQMLESASDLGLGWFLNATSVITRAVRGMPDDIPNYGYLYSTAITTDFRSDGDKYYFDSLDSQQDAFQFNINGHSGSFFIGKDHQIVCTPLSKINITYTAAFNNTGLITTFKIIAEDGTSYDFDYAESSQISSLVNTQSGYANNTYNSSWYLSRVISPFNTDTIKFNYTQTQPVNTPFTLPQTLYMRNADAVVTSTYSPTGTLTYSTTKISSIIFPDKKTLSFAYTNAYPNNATENPVAEINLSDTIFRYGYKLNYKSTDANSNYIRLLLSGVTPYTSRGSKKGYAFSYGAPYLISLLQATGNPLNSRDHWGFYNGANNGSNAIPYVNGMSGGANRNPNLAFTMASSLTNFYLPDGGFIFYQYELNDHYPYVKDPYSLTVQANTNSQNNITLNQVFNSKHQLVFNLDNSVSRTGAAPISGSGNLICNIKSTDGSILYATTSISLFDLFYLGIKTWPFNLANGSYRLETQLSGGTSITGSFPLNITWENKLPDNTTTGNIAGGLRVKSISRSNEWDSPGMNNEEYRYITADGKSSGFLGDIPQYDYPYRETVINGGTTITDYTAVSSDPINNLNYAQGSPVGYSRVEVIKGTATHNIGKTVYEFTSLQDVNSNIATPSFPYAPQDLRNWGIGLPKSISVYDSSNVLIKRTVNTVAFDTINYISSNNKSLKLGKSATTYYGNPANSSTPKTRTYLAQEYYPASGRMYIASSTDTLFQSNGSKITSYKNFTYDANYNVSKIVSSYDKSRGLLAEQRLYYPYNYTIGGAIGSLRNNGITTPVIAAETWITGDANPRIVAASITDYQVLNSGYIKPLTTYALESNKPLTQAVIGSFNPGVLNRNTTYFKPQQSFVLFDNKANLLQVQSPITGQSGSVIMDYNNLYPIAKISNAAGTDVAYTSFESDGSGNWNVPNPGGLVADAFTGNLSYNLSNGYINKTGLNNAYNYLLTVWAKSPSGVYVNNRLLTSPIAQQNGWELFSITLPNASIVHINGYGLIDELRLHPKDANMVTSTYEPGLGLVTSTVDANNMIVYNEYDTLNRIKIIRDKNKNIIKRYDYADPAVNTSPNWLPYSRVCRDGINGVYDSLYQDNNANSATYLQTQIVSSGTNYCVCSTPAYHPEYKLINGNCELGLQTFTSSAYIYVCDANGCVWKWRCIYHYTWSDNSVSQDYFIYSNASCGLEQ